MKRTAPTPLKKKTTPTTHDYTVLLRRVLALELLVRQLSLATIEPRLRLLEARQGGAPPVDMLKLVANRYADRMYEDITAKKDS